jgi:hypothetical protein
MYTPTDNTRITWREEEEKEDAVRKYKRMQHDIFPIIYNCGTAS